MISTERFIRESHRLGFGLYAGVPCSYLTPLINAIIDSSRTRYIGAANEGDAVAVACGAEIGGTLGVVMFQNSGFGNAINPLTSLATTMKIPVLVITTWRGNPDDRPDEPQHHLMGRITPGLMDLLGINWERFPETDGDVTPVLKRALDHFNNHRLPYGLIMREGTVGSHRLQAPPDLERTFQLDTLPAPQPTSERLEQDDVLRTVQTSARDSDVIIATTGYTGRALYASEDKPNQLYMVGSMGCASSIGLGLAIAQPSRRIMVIDGDGAALMRMGALATIGHERPNNFLHILLDNAVHDSTGSQATASPTVDFTSVALACGYATAQRIPSLDELSDALRNETPCPKFLHVKTKPRQNRTLPRPSITPPQMLQRLKAWMGT